MRHKKEIDLCNAFFCLFIVLIHLTPGELLQKQGIFLLHRMLNFATFGFIFLSGLKNAMGHRVGYRKYFLGRWKRIVLPYMFACLVYWMVYGLGKGLGLSLFRLAGGILTGGLDAHFYFVIVIIQFYFLTPLIDRISSRWTAGRTLFLSWCVNLVYVAVACSFSWYSKCFARYLVCYMLGICAGKQYDRFTQWLQNKRHILFITYLLLLAGELYAAWSIRFSGFPVLLQQLINFMYNPLAVCAFYWLCLKGKQWGLLMQNRGLSLINRHSYSIFLYHILINYFGDLLTKKMEISLLPAVIAMRVIWCGFWIWILICIGELSQKKER